jgi:hypothetical protein
MEVKLHTFSVLEVDGNEWLVSPCGLSPLKEHPVLIGCVAGQADSRTALEVAIDKLLPLLTVNGW